MAVTIDPVVFWERLSKLHKGWNVSGGPLLDRRTVLHVETLLLRAPLTWPPSPLTAPVLQAARDADGVWKGADALVIEAGEADEDRLYSKSQSMQQWLLGWEFPETVIVICSRSVHVLSSKKKGAPIPQVTPLAAGRCDIDYPVASGPRSRRRACSRSPGAAEEGRECHLTSRVADT